MMTLRLFIVSALAVVILLMPPVRVSAQGAEAEWVLKAREAALAVHDLEAVLALFADDAVVITSSGRRLVGKERILSWVQEQIDRRQREEAGPRHHLHA